MDAELNDDGAETVVVSTASKGVGLVPVILLLVVGLVGGWFVLSASDSGPAAETEQPLGVLRQDDAAPSDQSFSERFDAVMAAQSIPRSLVLAELYSVNPTAEGLRLLFEDVGGLDGLTMAAAEGSFDLVRFDPLNQDRLLAANRISYGVPQNEKVNQRWELSGSNAEGVQVSQSLWAPDIPHDFVHYNVDGTATMWIHGGGDGFAPRVAVFLDNDVSPPGDTAAEPGTRTRTGTETSPLYASRFTAANGKLFALTGNGEYQSRKLGYDDLVVDDGTGTTVLAAADGLEWLDNPVPELLVAYPTSSAGVTRVWNTETLEELIAHPLAGRSYSRAAISGDGRTAVGATFGGNLQVLSLPDGTVTTTFANVDLEGVDQPITLSADGSLAVTVERLGRVTIWWVGDNKPVVSFAGSSGQPRWVSDLYAPTSASAVAANGARVALRVAARASDPTRWLIIDTDPRSWVDLACGQAGRALSEAEAGELGLPDGDRACGGTTGER